MRIYFYIGVIVLVASIFNNLVPLIASAIAGLICVILQKKNPIIVGSLSSGLAALLTFSYLIILGKAFPSSNPFVDPDIMTGSIALIIGSFITGAIVGLIYKFVVKRNSQAEITTQGSVWPWWSIFTVSFLLSPGAAYLVTWQALKRIGEKEIAKKFLLIGGFILIIVNVVVQLYLAKNDSSVAKYALQFAGIGFPYWYLSYFNNWKTKTEGKTSFDWSLALWTIAGIILALGINLIVIIALSSLGIVK